MSAPKAAPEARVGVYDVVGDLLTVEQVSDDRVRLDGPTDFVISRDRAKYLAVVLERFARTGRVEP